MILLTQAIWREYRWEMVLLFSQNLLQQQCMATHSDLGWLNIPLWSVFWKPSLRRVPIVCMHWAPTKVLDCEKGFEMKYFNSGVVGGGSVGACLSTDMHTWLWWWGYACACVWWSIWFHCIWPVGFIITHFNEVASDRATRSLRVMFHWESAKTATRWFSWEWLEY